MQEYVVNLNNYVLPDIKVSAGTKYILNGKNNSFFKYVKERYNGSPTNAGIINQYVNYIIGEGLVDKEYDLSKGKSGTNVRKYISNTDLRLICQDYKMQAQFAVQVIWSQGSVGMKNVPEVKPKPLLMKYIPVDKIGFNQDKNGVIDGYWYSYDWEKQGTYKPQLFPVFDGTYKGQAIEIFYVKRISSETYFATPDYLSGLQYALIEEELSNSATELILNDFSVSTIIDIEGGNPTDELKAVYVDKMTKKLFGSRGRKVVFNWINDTEGGKITVNKVEPTQYNEIFTNFTDLAERKLFAAHSVSNPILFGVREGSGLGSNSDEMKEALKTLYRSNINPMREVIIDGLEYVLRFAEPMIELKFEDFAELKLQDSPQPTKNNGDV